MIDNVIKSTGTYIVYSHILTNVAGFVVGVGAAGTNTLANGFSVEDFLSLLKVLIKYHII